MGLFVMTFDYKTKTGWVRVILDDVIDFYFNESEFVLSRCIDGMSRKYESNKIKNLKISQ